MVQLTPLELETLKSMVVEMGGIYTPASTEERETCSPDGHAYQCWHESEGEVIRNEDTKSVYMAKPKWYEGTANSWYGVTGSLQSKGMWEVELQSWGAGDTSMVIELHFTSKAVNILIENGLDFEKEMDCDY